MKTNNINKTRELLQFTTKSLITIPAKIELYSTFISYHTEGNSNVDKVNKIIQIWRKAPINSKLKKGFFLEKCPNSE